MPGPSGQEGTPKHALWLDELHAFACIPCGYLIGSAAPTSEAEAEQYATAVCSHYRANKKNHLAMKVASRTVADEVMALFRQARQRFPTPRHFEPSHEPLPRLPEIPVMRGYFCPAHAADKCNACSASETTMRLHVGRYKHAQPGVDIADCVCAIQCGFGGTYVRVVGEAPAEDSPANARRVRGGRGTGEADKGATDGNDSAGESGSEEGDDEDGEESEEEGADDSGASDTGSDDAQAAEHTPHSGSSSAMGSAPTVTARGSKRAAPDSSDSEQSAALATSTDGEVAEVRALLMTAGWGEEELADPHAALQNKARKARLHHAAVAVSHAASVLVVARVLKVSRALIYRWRSMYRSIADAAIAWAESDPRPSPFVADASLAPSPRPPPPPTPSFRAPPPHHTSASASRQLAPPCLHCASRPPSALSLPCAHVVVCEACATRLARCPQCHTAIERAVVRRRLCSRSPRKRPFGEALEAAPSAEPSEQTGSDDARRRFLEQQVQRFRDLYLQACHDAGIAPSV